MVDSLRAAATWGITPLEFFRLDPRDQGLMEGYALLDQSIRSHGYPGWIAEDPDNMGRFEVHEKQDFAAEAQDLWRASHKPSDKNPRHGMREYVVLVPPKTKPRAS